MGPRWSLYQTAPGLAATLRSFSKSGQTVRRVDQSDWQRTMQFIGCGEELRMETVMIDGLTGAKLRRRWIAKLQPLISSLPRWPGSAGLGSRTQRLVKRAPQRNSVVANIHIRETSEKSKGSQTLGFPRVCDTPELHPSWTTPFLYRVKRRAPSPPSQDARGAIE